MRALILLAIAGALCFFGWQYVSENWITDQKCPACQGRGYIPLHGFGNLPCRYCGEGGKVSKRRQREILAERGMPAARTR